MLKVRDTIRHYSESETDAETWAQSKTNKLEHDRNDSKKVFPFHTKNADTRTADNTKKKKKK